MIDSHAEAISGLPTATRELVLDALRVRAMDFVSDCIGGDAYADECADVVRRFVDEDDDRAIFDPDMYDRISL